jgi:hypothetical protein
VVRDRARRLAYAEARGNGKAQGGDSSVHRLRLVFRSQVTEGDVEELKPGEGVVHSVAFEVDAEAAWTIVVKPIEQARAWNPTTVLNGTGDDVLRVSPPSAGLVTLQLTHSGRSNFAVQSYSLDGDSDLLANEIGKFKGEVLLPDQTALLTVEADGAWTGTPG